MESQPPVTQPIANAPDVPAVAEVGDVRWVSHHLFHDGDREALLTRVVRPVLSELWSDGTIDSFFFIRYEEGGKHLRLRLRVAPGVEAEAAATLARALLEARCEAPAAPGETVPPTGIVRAGFELETERYGGLRFFPRALAFFALSSLDALDFIERCAGMARARQLTEILDRLARQAIGLARTVGELRELADYFIRRRAQMEPVAARGHQMFESRRDDFVRRVRLVFANAGTARASTDAAMPGSPEAQAAHARCLAAALDGLKGEARWRATTNQIHITANRLGLSNPEESYLSAILCRCVDALGPELDALVAGAATSGAPAEPLEAMVGTAMQAFFTRGDPGASGGRPALRIDASSSPSSSRDGET